MNEKRINHSLTSILNDIKNRSIDNCYRTTLKRIQTKTAYSLAEAIISVIVLGIIVSTVIPNFSLTLEKTRASEGVKILSALLTAQRAYFAENQAYAPDLVDLDITISNPKNFNALTDASVDTDPTAVAQVTRTGGTYTLSINKDGDVSCNDGGGTICGNLGY